jgi:hypothetical protein
VSYRVAVSKDAVNVQSVSRGKVHRSDGGQQGFPWPECRSYPIDASRSTPTYRMVALAVDCVRCHMRQLTEDHLDEARRRGELAIVVPV